MATITATKAGNWNDTTVWDLGRIPAFGDSINLAGYVVVFNYGQSAVGEENDIVKNLYKALYERFTTVTNSLNTDVSGRFYFKDAEDAVHPYVVYDKVTGVADKTFTEDYEDLLIQFSLFSLDKTEIENMLSHCKELFDDCVFQPVGADLVWMKRTNDTPIDDVMTSETGTSKIYGYAVEYEVKISKH